MQTCEIAAAPTQSVTTKTHTASEFQRGVAASIPVMVGFIPFALVLGTNAMQKGFTTPEVPLMTGLNFGGGSEFAAVDVWGSPPAILVIVAITFLVNSRHLIMGAALAPHLRHLPRWKALPALFLMCDESWAMGLADTQSRKSSGIFPSFSLPYYLGLSLCLYATWVLFTAAGALLGPRLGDIRAYGFDMAFPAVFLVLLRGMWKGLRPALPWLVSLAVAMATYRLIPGAWYLPAGAVAGVAFACWNTKSPS